MLEGDYMSVKKIVYVDYENMGNIKKDSVKFSSQFRI